VLGVRRGRDVLVLAAAEQRRQCRQELGGVAERPVLVEVELVEVLAEEDDDFGATQDPDVRRQSELEREFADEPVPERVERRDLRVRIAVRHELVHPHRHLVRRLVREGQGEDLRGAGAPGGDQPGDPPGDHLGLAGSRSRDHEQRTLTVGHGSQLVRVQAAQQGLHTDRRRRGRQRRVHDRDEVAPGGDLLERSRFPPARSRPGPVHLGRRESVSDGGHERSIAERRDT
jgi:hypothetical protein